MPNEKFSSYSAKEEFTEDASAMRVGPSQAPKLIAALLVVGLAGAVAVHMWKTSAKTNVTAAAEQPAVPSGDADESASPAIEYGPAASIKQDDEPAASGPEPKTSYGEARRKRAAAADARSLRVESVSVIGKQSSCVINGKRLKQGGVVDGFRVERFSGGAVVVARDGFLFELRPPTKAAPPPSDRARDHAWSGGSSSGSSSSAAGGQEKSAGPTVWAPAEPPKRPTEPDDDTGDDKWDKKWDARWGNSTQGGSAPRSGPMKSRSR